MIVTVYGDSELAVLVLIKQYVLYDESPILRERILWQPSLQLCTQSEYESSVYSIRVRPFN